MDRFNIKLCATITCITLHNLQEPSKAVNIGNAVSGLQDLLQSNEHLLSGSYSFLSHGNITRCTGITDVDLLNQIIAIWHEVPTTNAPATPSPEASAFDLYEALTKLIPAQLTTLEFLLGVPNEELAPDTMVMRDRVVILLRYLNKETGGLDKLRAELTKSHPHLLKR